jgi:adenosylhomocysteinase
MAKRKTSYDVKDLKLADKGRDRIAWAAMDMPVLAQIQKDFQKRKPLKGIRISACLHVTTETANLMKTLKAGGADLVLCASNPLSTQDDVAASLVKHDKIACYAIKGEDHKTYYEHIAAAIAHKPHITMDDGADVVGQLLLLALNRAKDCAKPVQAVWNKLPAKQRRELVDAVIGGCEETSTGVIRLRAMEDQGVLQYPIVAVNDANTKHFFDNRYGTGQSTMDGILRATNRLYAGSRVVVCGYGWCGRGVAMRAHGAGARVIICEVDPLRALEAVMDGYEVMPIKQAAKIGNIFVTVTGDINVIAKDHFKLMKDGAIVCNSGHFNVELDLKGLRSIAKGKPRVVREFVEEYTLANGKRIYVLADGRLVNLSAAEGHPACVMDMSFANQALCSVFMVQNAEKLEKRVYKVPVEIDERIAALKLKSMGIQIDTLTAEQRKYLASWEAGT